MAKAPKTFNPLKAAMKTGNPYVGAEVKTESYLNTGSYALNALMSGRVDWGIPNNRVVMYSGDPSVGKTYIMLRQCAQLVREGYHIYYFDTESAVDDASFKTFGMERGTYSIIPEHVVNRLRGQIYSIVKDYEEYYNGLTKGTDEYKNRTKIAIFIDSIGNTATTTGLKQTENKKEERDMSKAADFKRLFSELTVPCGLCEIPFIASNHEYATMDPYGEQKQVAGGTGGRYNASIIASLRKKDIKNDKGILIGSEVTVTIRKSRFVRPKLKCKFFLHFTKGLHPWYGMDELMLEAGLIKKGTVPGQGNSHKYIILNDELKDSDGNYHWCEIDDFVRNGKYIRPLIPQLNEWLADNWMLKSDVASMFEEDVEDEEFEKSTIVEEKPKKKKKSKED